MRGCFQTIFIYRHKGKECLVTARHVVNGIKDGDQLGIVYNDRVNLHAVGVVGLGLGDCDVAALNLNPKLCVFKGSHVFGDLLYGQHAYYLGFPYRMAGKSVVDVGIHMPFIRAGMISTIMDVNDVTWLYIDGYSNPGFSGGPVYAPVMPNGDMGLVGVVAAQQRELSELVNRTAIQFQSP